MNFYKHHIGDYASATAHLNWDEDMAYMSLLRVYYRDEKPLPLDLVKVCRLVRAQSKDQKAAVEAILTEFFEKRVDGWHNKRCDEEIQVAKDMGGDAQEKRENEKERQRRHREERKKLFATLRSADIILPFDTVTEVLRSRVTALNGHARVTQPSRVTTSVTGVTGHGYPDSTSQKEDSERETLSAAGQHDEADPRKTLWRLAVSLLGEDSRAVVGAAIKRVGELKVGEILGSMAVKPPADPKPYFIKSTQERGVVV